MQKNPVLRRRSFIGTLGAACSYAMLPDAFASSPDSELPNIIIFLVDDMGLMDTSCPMLTDAAGHPKRHALNDWYRTPNMERLAEKGVRFSNFYAHSVCSPTRISIMTGQNSARHAATTWINPISNNRGKYGPPEWDWDGIDSDDATLPRLLRDRGYRTIHVGKAHFGPKDHFAADPRNIGFDVNIGGTYAGRPASYYSEDGYGNKRGDLRAVPHLEKHHDSGKYLSEALTLEAKAAVTESVKAGKPFFLNMSHYAVHAPFQPDPRFSAHYSGSDKSPQAQAFATMIEGVDKSLGDIVSHLNDLGVADRTLLIFLGDNGSDAPLGGAHDYGSSKPLLGKKGSHHEGGMRVPFIAAWIKPDPNETWQRRLPIQSGGMQSQIGTILDLFPTICNLTDTASPAGHALDGFDLKEQFAGRRNKSRSEIFLNHFPHDHRSSYYTAFVKGDWKLVYHYGIQKQPRCELYNLRTDPFEKNELSSSDPQRVNALLKDMLADMRAKGALMPVVDGRELSPQDCS
jgi:arylsulfatase A-like enzyme